MKTVQLTAQEFMNFKALANQIHLIFMYSVSGGKILVEADAATLHELGY